MDNLETEYLNDSNRIITIKNIRVSNRYIKCWKKRNKKKILLFIVRNYNNNSNRTFILFLFNNCKFNKWYK